MPLNGRSIIKERIRVDTSFKVDKKPKLRRQDLVNEKQRLTNLLYYYRYDIGEDEILKKMIRNIDNELRILDEMKEKNKRPMN